MHQSLFGKLAPSLLLVVFLSSLASSAESLSFPEVQKMAAKLDGLLDQDLAKKKLSPLPVISDDVFVRRAYLGIVGRIPTPQEVLSFLDNNQENKRHQLIEQLVSSPGYESHAFNYYADLLRLDSNRDQHGLGWHVYLRKALADDKPYNQLVHEMLSAEGHTAKNPAVGYYLRDRGMLLDNVSNTMQVFLGHQIGCAQCHDHPFDTWTQMEYYELAAFSSGMEFRSQISREAINTVIKEKREQGELPSFASIKNNKDKKAQKKNQKAIQKINGDYRNLFRYFQRNEIATNRERLLKLPDDYKYEDGEPGESIQPATIFGHKLKDVAPEKRKEEFANWVTSGNDYFAKVIANRLWSRTFGRGLVEPMDDWSNNSSPSHPEVMSALAQLMVHLDYNTRDFERVLYHTKLFQREVTSTETSRGFGHTFIGPHLRRLSAEQIHDSLLVLNFGNVDDKINTSLEEKWNAYSKDTLELINSSPSDLIAYKDQANKAEKEKIDYQRKNRALQIKLNAANKKKDTENIKVLRKDLKDLRDNYNESKEMLSSAMERNIRGKSDRNMRASEYPTPFRGDHMVRLFGGSDRNAPESSHTQASTPQALTLLNGQIASSTEQKRSKIFEALQEISNPETRLEYLFLAFYSAKPTEAEIEELLPVARDREGIFSLARAMLTTKRFLFVQ